MPFDPSLTPPPPTVVFGSTGRIGSQFAFLAIHHSSTHHLVLQGSSLPRLEGLRREILESGVDHVKVTITTEVEEAARFGGNIFYTRSIPSDTALTREEMLLDNARLSMEVGRALAPHAQSVRRLVCVSNPSDLIGLSLLVHGRLSPEQVISLSALDSTRYSLALSERLNVPTYEIQGAYTLGSHDQKMAVMRDTVRIKGKSIDELIHSGVLDENGYQEIVENVVRGGVRIIKLRGHTAYQSPALLSLKILEARDASPFNLPCSRYINTEDFPYAFLSLPSLVGTKGCQHLEFSPSPRDAKGVHEAYLSVASQRDELIAHHLLPPPQEWPEQLQRETTI